MRQRAHTGPDRSLLAGGQRGDEADRQDAVDEPVGIQALRMRDPVLGDGRERRAGREDGPPRVGRVGGRAGAVGLDQARELGLERLLRVPPVPGEWDPVRV